MKVYYIENDEVVIIFKGEFKDCLEFYMNNKSKYREHKKYITIGG